MILNTIESAGALIVVFLLGLILGIFFGRVWGFFNKKGTKEK